MQTQIVHSKMIDIKYWFTFPRIDEQSKIILFK